MYGTEQALQIKLQRGVRHPSISLNGQHAYSYNKGVTPSVEFALFLTCMCCCLWERCSYDNYYSQRD